MRRFVYRPVLGIACGLVLFPMTPARAQWHGGHAGVTGFAPVDAAALGESRPSSVGLFLSDNSIALGGGGSLAGGAFRLYGGGPSARYESHFVLGAAWARTLATRDVAGPLHASVGGEVLGAFRHNQDAPHEAGAVSLSAPLGVSLGAPSNPSLGIFAVPYAEVGLARRWGFSPAGCPGFCDFSLSDVGLRHAFGVGAGARLSFGRIAAVFAMQDVVVAGPQLGDAGGKASLGLTFQLGK